MHNKHISVVAGMLSVLCLSACDSGVQIDWGASSESSVVEVSEAETGSDLPIENAETESSETAESETTAETTSAVTEETTTVASETETSAETTETTVETTDAETSVTTEETEPGGFGFDAETEAPAVITEEVITTTAAPVNSLEVQFTGKLPVDKEMSSEVTSAYGYETLDEYEKVLYNEIKRAVKEYKTTVDASGYSEETWDKVFSIFYYQEPDYFYLNPLLETGTLSYKTTDSTKIAQMQGEIDVATNMIVNEAKKCANDLDRVKLIHDIIIKNNDFHKDGGGSYAPSIYAGLVTRTPQCEGYAKTFTYLCRKCGLEAITITGNVSNGLSHAWNKVNVDGDWYCVDCTRDDPILDTPDPKYIRYNYFMVPDAWILDKTHFRENESQMFGAGKFFDPPVANRSDFNYYNIYDHTINDYELARQKLTERATEALKNKEPIVQIKVSDEGIYNQINDNIISIKDEAVIAAGVQVRTSKVRDDEMLIIGLAFEY